MKSQKRRKFTDKAAHWVITLGGAATVFVILALFFFIFLEVYPLLQGARVTDENTYTLEGKVVSIGVDNHQEVAYAVYSDGVIEFISLSNGEIVKKHRIAGLRASSLTRRGDAMNLSPHSSSLQEGNAAGHAGIVHSAHGEDRAGRNQIDPSSHGKDKGDGKTFSRKTDSQGRYITSVSKDNNRLVFGTNDGRLVTVSVDFSESFDQEKRLIQPEIAEMETVQVPAEGDGIRCVVSRRDEGVTVTAVLTEDERLMLISSETERSLFGEGERKDFKKDITDIVMQHRRDRAFLKSSGDKNIPPQKGGNPRHDIQLVSHNPMPLTEAAEENTREITALALDLFLENLYVGTSSGEVFHINVRDRNNPRDRKSVV